MDIIKTEIPDLLLIKPRVFEDDRGFFLESYNYNKLKEYGVDINFVQDNHSKSQYGVIRGLHFQKNPCAQTKLIRALSGKILDVVVDVREGSPSFGKHLSFELSADNKHQLLIPQGFAHGFSVLSETAEIAYKCDNFYSPENDGGIIYNDPALNIDWKIDPEKAILSEKDLNLKTLDKADMNFNY